MTPAARNAWNRLASTDVGLASRVISTAPLTGQCPPTAAIRSATVPGSISDGVPPPKKMLVTVRPPVSPAKWESSPRRAARHRPWSMVPATWLLKSQ